jgi:hypothetical protein
MPDGGAKPGTAAMIVASTSRTPSGNRSPLTGRFLSRASAVPSLRKQTSARAGLRHAASDSRLGWRNPGYKEVVDPQAK